MPENNYCIVQTSEHKDTFLSVLPSCWIIKNGWRLYGTHDSDRDSDSSIDGDDLCYWPKGVAGYRLLEKSKKDPKIKPDTKLLHAFRCKIKRNKFASYSEAFRELKIMEMNSDTEEYGTKKKMRKNTTAADLFKQIQKSKPGPSREYPAPNQGVKVAEAPVSLLSKSKNEAQTDMGSSSSSLLEQRIRETQFSGTERTPPLNRSSVDESYTVTPDLRELLLSLHEKVDKNTIKIEECKLIGNRSVTLLSQVNAKLDVLASQLNMKLDAYVFNKSQQMESECVGTMSAPLNPIKSVEELESLERKANNKEFIGVVIKYLGSMHGKDRYVGQGGTVCLQIVDYFFDREFLRSCSWTGTSRHKNSNEITVPKIPFHKFDGVITLFHKVVMFSDPSYPLVECQNFLKRCLRNAKQRFEETKGIRAPVARKKRNRNTNQSVLCSMIGKEEKQDDEEEEVEEEPSVDEGMEKLDEEEPSVDEGLEKLDEEEPSVDEGMEKLDEEEDQLVDYGGQDASYSSYGEAVVLEEYILK